MSKAFVKEDAPGSVEVLPDREMLPHANLVTVEGLAQIDAKIAKLQEEQANSSQGDAPPVARDLRYPDASQVKFGSRVMVERNDGSRDRFWRTVADRWVVRRTLPITNRKQVHPLTRSTVKRQLKRLADHQVIFHRHRR